MKIRQHTALLCVDAAAFGLFAAWLIYSLAPIWPIAGKQQDNLGLYVPARIFFYGALAVSTIVINATSRLRPEQEPGPHYRLLIALGVISQLVAGVLGRWYKYSSGQEGFWIISSFVLSGAVVPILQAAWIFKLKGRVRERPGLFILCAAIAGVSAIGLLVSMNTLNDLLYSFLPLGSLVLLVPTRCGRIPIKQRAETSSRPETHENQRGPTFLLVLTGLACTLAGSHVFNGTAEFGTFLQRGTILVGIFVGIAAAVAVIVIASRSRTGIVAALTVSTIIVISSIATQGLIVNAVGTLGGALGYGLHAAVLAGEYLIYALGFYIAFDSVDTTNRRRIPALISINGGVAVGAISGILVTADILTYTVLSFAFSSAALLLLGISWGIRYAQPKVPFPSLEKADRCPQFEERYALSEREKEVFRLWISGHQLDYVSEALCISKNTVKTHVSHIYKKTGTSNREELIQLYESSRASLL